MSTLRKIVAALLAAPFLFFVLQLPEASIDLVERFLGRQLDQQPFLSVLLLLPYFWVASTLSTSLTFAAVMQRESGQRPSFNGALRLVEPRLFRILSASCLAGVVILLGLTLLLPGLYFMAVYLFVPFLVLRDSEPASPFSVLNRSKKLAERRFLPTVGLTLGLVALGLVFHFAGERLGAMASSLVSGPILSETLFFTVKLFLSAVVGATMNVAVSYFFLWLADDGRSGREAIHAGAGGTP